MCHSLFLYLNYAHASVVQPFDVIVLTDIQVELDSYLVVPVKVIFCC